MSDILGAINTAFDGISEFTINEGFSLADKYNLPVERLGASTSVEPYPFTLENALEFLSAAKAAYPNGLPDRSTYFELGMALAELVVVHKWPKIEARKILDEVGSKPAEANRANNDIEWANFLTSVNRRPRLSTNRRPIVSTFRLIEHCFCGV